MKVKPLFLSLLMLPISGVLYTFSDNSYWLLAGGHAALDGVGAGIYGAISDYRCRSHA
jgi:hypothetical protein